MTEYDPLVMQFDGDRDASKIANRLRFERWRHEVKPEADPREPQEMIPPFQTVEPTAIRQLRKRRGIR